MIWTTKYKLHKTQNKIEFVIKTGSVSLDKLVLKMAEQDKLELEIILMAGFKSADKDNDGFLTREELQDALKSSDLDQWTNMILSKADTDKNGQIDYQG